MTNPESASRAAAEAARETEWAAPSFVRELFAGKLRMDLVDPFPAPTAEEVAHAAPFFERLAELLRTVDSDAIDRNGKVPDHLIQQLRQIGALGIKIPAEFGGLGLSQLMYTRAIGMVTSQDGSLTALLSASQSIGVAVPLMLFGTDRQKQRYLPRLAGGEISAFALTETEVGSDPAGLATEATRSEDGSHYVLNGEKLWCTNGPIAGLMVVMARTRKRISAFIVERDFPGVEVVHRLEFMGLKAIENGVIRFNNVRVPAENLLWDEGSGLKLALITLNTGRLTLPASAVAGCKVALRISRRWAADRVQWGAPIGKHDAVAQMLGKMTADTYAMEAVSELASLLADRGDTDIRLEAAIAKLWNTEKADRIIDATLQIKGGRGYETVDSLRRRGERPDPVERMYRDNRINRIFEGSSEIMRLFIAREAVDTHLQVAGDLIDPRKPMSAKLRALLRSALFYLRWYPPLWLGHRAFGFGRFGKLSGHLAWVERRSRKLARVLFHAMIRFGPKLEQRQSVLFRLVDVGAELFAMSSVIARAQSEARAGNQDAVELADLFCRHARRRIDDLFRGVYGPDDVATYKVAQRAMAGDFEWLERGTVEARR